MFAVSEDHAEVAKLLIAAGADVNVRSTLYDFNFRKVAAGGTQAVYSRGGLTPLLLAARQGAIESAKVLLDAGADINMPEQDYGFTPLLEAILQRPLRFRGIPGRSQGQPQGRRVVPHRRNAQSRLSGQPPAQGCHRQAR